MPTCSAPVRRPRRRPRADALAVVRQHDRQVVDVHRAVAGELARGPRHAGLAVVGQYDRQVVDVYLAVPVGIAGQQGLQDKRLNRVSAGVVSVAGDVAVIVDGCGVVEDKTAGQDSRHTGCSGP